MVRREPVPASQSRYECQQCRYVATGKHHGPTCPECDGSIRLAAVNTVEGAAEMNADAE